MFEVTATGLNEHYGKKGEKKLLRDESTLSALRGNWIESKIRYVGQGKHLNDKRKIKEMEILQPFKKVYVEKLIESQTRILMRIEDLLKRYNRKNINIAKLIMDGVEK